VNCAGETLGGTLFRKKEFPQTPSEKPLEGKNIYVSIMGKSR
jgi:hypothetical protein